MTTPTTVETGVCRGCGETKSLRADGKIRDHFPPPEMRVAGDRSPCPGGGRPAEGERVRPAVPPPIVMVPAEKPSNRGQCRICGRSTQLRSDGRVARHLDLSRFDCDGAGKLPTRVSE